MKESYKEELAIHFGLEGIKGVRPEWHCRYVSVFKYIVYAIPFVTLRAAFASACRFLVVS